MLFGAGLPQRLTEIGTVYISGSRCQKQLASRDLIFMMVPSYDHCGYEVAIQMLLHSRHPGRHSRDHVQLDPSES
jgi:hypothetical protein